MSAMSSTALFETAFSSACISKTSISEVSSTTSKSQLSGLLPPRLKPPRFKSTASSRLMVFAANPVASVIRLAPRPVGAHSSSIAPSRRECADAFDSGETRNRPLKSDLTYRSDRCARVLADVVELEGASVWTANGLCEHASVSLG